MCGIVAVLGTPGDSEATPLDDVLAVVDASWADLDGSARTPADLTRAATALATVDHDLRGPRGVLTLRQRATGIEELTTRTTRFEALVGEVEHAVDAGGLEAGDAQLETMNAALVGMKDAVWSLGHDRARSAAAVADLAGHADGDAAVRAYAFVQTALSAIDRLEIRGRDSAGLHLLVSGHGLDLDDPEVAARIRARSDPLFRSTAVRTPEGHLVFVYKVAAEIGELGDNTRALRAAIRSDGLLREAVAAPSSEVTVLGHTRWASVGLISEPNAHPLTHEELDEAGSPYYAAALNGDIDNHVDLRGANALRIAPEITTDAKLIPVLMSRRSAGGASDVDAFQSAVSSFAGSMAIAVSGAADPGRLLLAVRGSGQALYVGLAPGAYVVASEPYGLVEETASYVRLDGETPSPAGVHGQIVVLDRAGSGTVDGVHVLDYAGNELPRPAVRTAEITTRDIDRAGAPHFLLKEIGESPRSVRKTLRGKVVDRRGRLAAALGAEAIPPELAARLAAGAIRRIVVTGQGTAAMAATAVAAMIGDALAPKGITVSSQPATELSGFGMVDDMSDTLVVAISQSGTTTDTLRTVDLVRARGAMLLSIVNRRGSDLVERSDGVLYTSDGRDWEMAVPSTKAYYAQIAAGLLLSLALAGAAGCADNQREHELLEALRDLPAAMETVLSMREEISSAARRHALSRRYWTVVGNGPNRFAAEELRIKLSELCYKSISCDATEDKKHIDLACEPLILVCAAGLEPAIASDVGKEVAIYRAHKAAPIVLTDGDPSLFAPALQVIELPRTHPSLAFVLVAMAGHLFGYEAAVAINEQALVLREARAVLESATAQADPEQLMGSLAAGLEPIAGRFFQDLRTGAYNGHLETNTAVRLASLLRYATGAVPLEVYEAEHGRAATPAALVGDLAEALTQGIDELTRPVDAIKHQAKTVTVGVSRSEDALFAPALVKAVLATQVSQDRLGYRALRALAALDASVAEVTGFTRYSVEGSLEDHATIHIVDRGGSSVGIPSRTDTDPTLRGTKHRVATEREVTVARGRSDGRTVIIVPEVKDNQVIGITLLQVRFHDRLAPGVARRVLSGFRGRYGALVDAVTETEPVFDDARLGTFPIIDLLVEPVHVLADRWSDSVDR